MGRCRRTCDPELPDHCGRRVAGERAEALLAPANAVQIQVQRPARIRPPWTSSEVGGPHRAEWVRATPVLTNRRRCRSRSG
jgi:hypothetical protein